MENNKNDLITKIIVFTMNEDRPKLNKLLSKPEEFDILVD